jgi:hypothetical protein
MAENHLPLAQILAGISGLKKKAELDAVRDAVKEIREKLKVARARREPIRFLTEEERVALAKGNSDEMIRVNKEKFDYSGVKESDRLMAEKWFKATKPYSKSTAYHHWRVWNWPPYKTYKGGLIIEKATGKSVPPPETPECESEPEWESEDEEEVTEEVTVAMAAVRVE